MNDKTCPLGHICDKCMWYVHVVGENPQTGAIIDKWDCAIAWIPIMLVDNSRQQHQTSAAVESFRNEMVKGNDAFLGMLSMASENASQKRIGAVDAVD